ncbi:DNA-binding protein [Archangium sp. Cb G35]|uniref:DNA-binding protein n=1 Tax=Archangium sp. Cb G35 TaxID=1920190 RepID=UPI0009FA72FB|nr:DNA-binding protein [Archangium sp. Cb G35]
MTRLSSIVGRSSRAVLWLPSLLLGLTLATGVAGCSSTPTISEGRENPNGTTVTIEGAVSVAPGTFTSALGDEGFAVQDESGGIYVKVTQKLGFGLNARVRVTGTLDEQNKLRILKAEPADVEVLSGTTQVSPATVKTGEVNESNEGRLVKVTGNITQTFEDDSPYGYKLYINDGSGEVQVFVHVSAGFNKAPLEALTAGQSITVVGLAAQYESTYEVAPRQPSDLTVN